MGFTSVEKIVAYQFARELCVEVYELIERSPRAKRDFRFRDQLQDAVSGIARTIAEGYGRNSPAEFANFLRFALGSVDETRDAILDGVDRRYFVASDAHPALTWLTRTERATKSLRNSQLRLVRVARRRKRADRRASAKPQGPATRPRGGSKAKSASMRRRAPPARPS